MRIPDRYKEVVKGWCLTESLSYQWRDTDDLGAEERRLMWAHRLQEMIEETLAKIDGGANYVHIESLTNMGLVDSRLTLTPEPWDQKRTVWLFMPPSPNGGISLQILED